MSLTFNAKNHRYKLDDKPVTGVTTIIGATDPKTALMDWYGRMVAEYVHDNPLEVERLREQPPVLYRGKERPALVEALRKVPYTIKDEAAERGTAIHDLGQRYLEGEELQIPTEHETPTLGLIELVDQLELEPLVLEHSMASREHWYSGRVDFIGTSPYLNGGEPVLIDWKTSNGVYPTVAMQAAAYARAEFHVTDEEPNVELEVPEITATYVAHIHHSYTELRPLATSPEEIDKHFSVFLKALQLWKSKRDDLAGALKDPLNIEHIVNPVAQAA